MGHRGRGGWLLAAGLLLGCGTTLPPAPLPGGEDGPPGVDPPSDGGQPQVTVPERIPLPLKLPPIQQDVPRYDLTLPEDVLGAFYRDVWTSERPATFAAAGQSFPVQVRLRGRSSRFWEKKSWRVELPSGVTLEGERKLNLIAMVQDQSMMIEKLAFDLLAAHGAPAPRAKFVRLYINGRYEGVFLQVQAVDKRFLKANRFLDDDADIYRCGTHDCEFKLFRQSYQGPWEKKTNRSEPSDLLEEFLQAVNRTPEPELERTLESLLELEHFLSSMTVDALIQNFTVEDSGSYLVYDRYRRKWTYVPWDYNNASSRFWPTYPVNARPLTDHPLFIFSLTDGWVHKRHASRVNRPEFPDYLPAFSNLTTRVALNPVLRERLSQKIERALGELFNEELMLPRIDALHALIDPYMKDDPYMDYPRFTAGRGYVKDFVKGRIPFIRAELNRYRTRTPTLQIALFDPQQGVIELVNRSEQAISTSGMVLTTNLRRALAPNLPALSLGPQERVRFTGQQLQLSFSEQGEVGLFDGKSVVGALDVLFYGQLPQGHHYARDPSAPSGWAIRPAAQ